MPIGSDWVFCTAKGGTLNHSRVTIDHFRPALKRAGCPQIRFHDLRHTCASLLLSKGVHVKIVSDMLGHASVVITLDTYSHVLPGLQRDAVMELEAFIGQAV